MSHKLAIDFGMTNSVIAHWNDQSGAAEFITLPGLCIAAGDGRYPLIPSLLYIQDGRAGQVMLGQTVRDNRLDQQRDNRLFRNFKRGIIAGLTGEPRIIDGAPWTDHDAGKSFLCGLIAAMLLAAMRCDRAAETLAAGYHGEQDSQVKARMLSDAVCLMSPAGEALVQAALHDQDAHIREVAEYYTLAGRRGSGSSGALR